MNKRKEKIKMIFDFDSTFIRLEALDELAGIALENHENKKKILAEIVKTTKLGMEGKISFPESLARRFKLLSANKKHLPALISHLKKNVSQSVRKNRKFFKNNHSDIYIISGGFEEYIHPVVKDFGIRRSNIISNGFIFGRGGKIIGFDKKRTLAEKNGKAKAVRDKKIQGEIWVIGDGYTDYEIKKSGAAQKFIAYCENIRRENVCAKADFTVNNLDELLMILNN